ncbi:XRE family transcriptional regulator [Ferrimonas sp.]|uniref:XRE family transcriptional regulator n=1 Tax=Ferrimonas sp. TaxID=2080861 RepID=UPI003A907DF3
MKNGTKRPNPEEQKGRFPARLESLLEGQSLRSFSRKVGISDTTIAKYLSGDTDPTLGKLEMIADACGVSLAWLVTGQEEKAAEVLSSEFDEEYALIDGFHASVSTGHGTSWDNEPVRRKLAFRKKWLSYRKLQPESLKVVFAKGDSMEPTIHSGDSILVDVSIQTLSDGSIFVLSLGGDLYAKRLSRRFDGGIEIISDNKEYDKQIVPADELEQLDIIGKVVWIGKDVD